MAAPSILGSNQSTSIVASIGVSITVPAGGGFLSIYVTAPDASVGGVTGVASTSGQGESYSLSGFGGDSTHTQGLWRWISSQALSPASFTVTATFITTASTVGIAARLMPGATAQLAACAGNVQQTPGTGVAGVTTGLSGTLSTSQAVLEGATITTSGAASISAAGGATLDATAWNPIKTNFVSFEYLQLSATTSVAATFTSGNGNPQVSVGGVWTVPSTGGATGGGGLGGGLDGGLTGGLA